MSVKLMGDWDNGSQSRATFLFKCLDGTCSLQDTKSDIVLPLILIYKQHILHNENGRRGRYLWYFSWEKKPEGKKEKKKN
jgi:hypothetical protein